MDKIELQDFPSLDSFLDFNPSEIKHFCEMYNVNTCYLPIDGTRRYFLLFNDDINNWNEDYFDKYFEMVNYKFRELLSQIYEHGIKNIIVLLMDKSAFSRGRAYLSMAIEKGIKPLYSDRKYLSLYEKYNIEVFFAGFTSVFEDYIEKYKLEDLENQFSNIPKNNCSNKLIIYNGLSPTDDYLLLERHSFELRKQNKTITKDELIKRIYKTPLDAIDFSIWYGYPRDKIIPPLLWEDGHKFFIKNPSLTLNIVQLKKIIYNSVVTKKSIKDKYFNHKFSDQEKEIERSKILEENSILGLDYYLID